jgi:hypothetical protein
MTGDYKIVVAPDGDCWRVAIDPPLPLGRNPEVVTDLGMAMARARLIRLRHGFPIVGPPAATARSKR